MRTYCNRNSYAGERSGVRVIRENSLKISELKLMAGSGLGRGDYGSYQIRVVIFNAKV